MLSFVAQVVSDPQMKAYIEDPKVNAADLEAKLFKGL
jgi:F-type H+-transporting ATPase subunit delta